MQRIDRCLHGTMLVTREPRDRQRKRYCLHASQPRGVHHCPLFPEGVVECAHVKKRCQLSNMMDSRFPAKDTAQNVQRKVAHVVHWVKRWKRQISQSTESSPPPELLDFRNCNQ